MPFAKIYTALQHSDNANQTPRISSSSTSTPHPSPIPDLEDEGARVRNDVEMKELGPRTSVSSDEDDPKSHFHDLDLLRAVESSAPEVKRVLRKLDRRVVLFVALLYMLSFLDRSNIGNARIAGLERDLNLTSDQYEWLLTAFYVAYIAFEWMALLFRLIPPHIYISLCVLAWGILASLQSLSTTFTSLLILRGLLGISEAAFTGIPFYLSFFYRRDELAARVGVFISAAPLATTFASGLAWAITRAGEGSGWAPWRLLFLVEGFPSIIVAYWVWKSLPDGPESATFLSQKEKSIAVSRLSTCNEEKGRDGAGAGEKKQRLKMREILETLRDPKCYLTAFMFFSSNVAFSSMPVFLPTIISEMGYSSTTSQALSAPPYLTAFLTVLLTAHLSDKSRTRSPYIITHALLASLGYAFILVAGYTHLPNWTRYLAIYPAAAGFFSCVTLIITWTLNNQDSDGKKGAGFALLQYFGQCGPLLGTRLYPETDGPLYLRGMGVCAGFMGLVALLAWVLRVVLEKENRARARAQIVLDGMNHAGGEEVELLDDGTERKGKEVFYFML